VKKTVYRNRLILSNQPFQRNASSVIYTLFPVLHIQNNCQNWNNCIYVYVEVWIQRPSIWLNLGWEVCVCTYKWKIETKNLNWKQPKKKLDFNNKFMNINCFSLIEVAGPARRSQYVNFFFLKRWCLLNNESS
jgi:hypothetical protein